MYFLLVLLLANPFYFQILFDEHDSWYLELRACGYHGLVGL